MSFSIECILTEFVEAGRLGRADVARTFEGAIIRHLAYRRARFLKAQRVWIASPVNREKKRLAMVAYRVELKGEGR